MSECPVKDCHNEATVEFGPFLVCSSCFDKCAYDMQPLILKNQDSNSADAKDKALLDDIQKQHPNFIPAIVIKAEGKNVR